MLNDVPVIAIIPARRGSRGIPHKNTMNLSGKPLIQWTLDAAIGSACIDRILVSTDDLSVRTIVAEQGIEVLRRPSELASDTASAAQVIAHALTIAEIDGIVVYLQPTSPLRLSHDIDECVKLLQAVSVAGVVSVSAVTEHPEWMYRFDETEKLLDPLMVGDTPFRRQDLPRTVRLNGAIYCAHSESLRPHGDIFQLTLAGYEMPNSRSIDIDDLDQLAHADRLLSLHSKHSQG